MKLHAPRFSHSAVRSQSASEFRMHEPATTVHAPKALQSADASQSAVIAAMQAPLSKVHAPACRHSSEFRLSSGEPSASMARF
jgi:hypothetical protein